MADATARSEAIPRQQSSGRGWRGRLLSVPGITLVLSILGLGVAGYLTYVHFDESMLVCSAVGGCHTVQESSYSTIGPVPIAALGVGMFLVVGALALARLTRSSLIPSEYANLGVWTITLTALLYYAYLTYVEIFVLEAICQWCVLSSIVTLGIFVTESVALWRYWNLDAEAAIE